jgi:hypothetical protein
MAKLSISRAWDESKGVLARDGTLLATVAIALLVLPGVIGDLVTPDAPPGQLPSPGPWMIVAGIAVLIGLVGQLAIIWLAMGSGASVGESLKHALGRAPSYIAATIIWVFPFALAIYALMISITPENPPPAAGLALLVLLPVMLFFFIRMILTSAVATAENVGALAILKRSWRLTAGSWWRLFGFFLVLVVAAVIVMVAVGVIVGLLARLVFGEIEPMTVGALVQSLLTQLAGAALTVVFIVMLARIYVQLAGDRSAEVSVPTSGT